MPINLSGSLVLTGSIVATGGITMSGSIASASFSTNATSASYAISSTSASYAIDATSASYAVNATSASYAVATTSASFAANATSASYAVNATSASYAIDATSASYAVSSTSASFTIQAQTASSADAFTVRNTLTAQTLVVQTITSSVDFVTGSTRFGSLLDNTHLFTGSILISSGSVLNVGRTDSGYPFTVASQFAKTDTTGRGLMFLGSNEAISSNPFGLVVTVTGASTLANRMVTVGTTDFGLANGGILNVQGVYFTGSSVGIGTISPSYTLDVSGNGRFNSGATAQNVIISSTNAGSTATTLQISNSTNSAYNDGVKIIQGGGVLRFHDLNGTALLGFDLSNTRVGVLTTAPLTPLDVKQSSTGAATANAAFRDNSTNGNALQIWNGNNEARFRAVYYGTPSDQNITFYTITSAGSEGERMRITGGGNVGIGVAPSDWNTLTPLQIKNVAFAGYTSGTTHVLYAASNFYYGGSGGGDKYITNGAASLYSQSSGEHIWFNAPVNSSGAGAALPFVERMRMTSGGVLKFSSVPFNNYHLDTSVVITVANGGTIPFETFSGLILVNNMSNGNIGMWMVGAGYTTKIAEVYGVSTGTMSYSGAINGYVWTSNYGSTANYGVFAVRTRSNA